MSGRVATLRRLLAFAIIFVTVVGASAFIARFGLSTTGATASRRASTVETSYLEVLGAEDGLIDLGEQPRGVVQRFQARVRNVSDETIRVSRISSTCACTIPDSGAFAIPPGETHVIDYSVAAPANEAEWGVSLYLKFDDEGHQKIPIRWRSPAPFPESVVWEGEEGVFLPIAPAYRQHVVDVNVYPHLEEQAISSRLDLERGGVFVEDVPHGTQTLDVVVAIGAAEDKASRAVQYVQLVASEEAESDSL